MEKTRHIRRKQNTSHLFLDVIRAISGSEEVVFAPAFGGLMLLVVVVAVLDCRFGLFGLTERYSTLNFIIVVCVVCLVFVLLEIVYFAF